MENTRTRRYPSFSLDAQAAYLLSPVELQLGDLTVTTPRGATMYLSAEARQPLTQLVELGLAVKLSAATVAFEQERVRGTRLALVHNVRRQYYALVQAASELETIEHSIALLQQVQREVSTRVIQRVALKAEGLDVDTRLARAELTRVTLRHALETQKEQFNQLLGRDVRTPFEPATLEAPVPVAATLDAAHGRALDARADIRQARIEVQQADLAQRIAEADALPDVGVAFTYLSPLNIEGMPRNIVTAALQVSWEPFDWGRKSRTAASKAIAVTQAKNAVVDAEQRAIGEVNAEFRRLELAQAELRVARLAQDAARENARVRTTQFQARAALLSDVLQSEASMADANEQYRKALRAFWDARAGLEYAVGEEQVR
jgi:outer membrane protein TolC